MTSKQERMQALLDSWRREYRDVFMDGVLPIPVSFAGYRELGTRYRPTMGLCTSWVDRSAITLGHKFEKRKLGWLEESVLWHEFAHAVEYHEDKDGAGHSDRWREIKSGKRWYVLGDALAKFLYFFWRA